LDDFDVDAGGEHEGGGAVAEVVQADGAQLNEDSSVTDLSLAPLAALSSCLSGLLLEPV
jgi:hypothetical protein